MSTFEKVKAVIVESLNIDGEVVTENASLSEDLGADSLSAVELIMALEDKFCISVPEDASKDVRTVNDLVMLVNALA
ncbi:MAG: acyl carrier protein [Clostridiales bacterium]|jgi:acyl carrier protein|nr:acyl carrier protein [Clostridiales bacterium]